MLPCRDCGEVQVQPQANRLCRPCFSRATQARVRDPLSAAQNPPSVRRMMGRIEREEEGLDPTPLQRHQEVVAFNEAGADVAALLRELEEQR